MPKGLVANKQRVMSRALRAAAAAKVSVARLDVNSEGFSVVFGEPSSADRQDDNSAVKIWDKGLADAANKKRIA